jgi:hypothetical protein
MSSATPTGYVSPGDDVPRRRRDFPVFAKEIYLEFLNARAGIVADARPGHVRLSPLVYNTRDDHVAAIEILAASRR